MSPKRSPFIWTRLHLPLPSSVDSAQAAVIALAGLAGQPRLVLEVVGSDGRVSWRLGCEAHVKHRALAALQAHLLGLRHTDVPKSVDGFARADLAVSLRLPGAKRLPLKHDATESTTRGLLAALSQANSRESVFVQLVLGPRLRPTKLPDVEARDRRVVAIKFAEPRFGLEIRIASSSADPARARSLIDGVAGVLRGLEVPGVRLQLVRSSVRGFSAAASPWFWRNVLSVSDIVPLTGWPMGDLPLAGVPDAHPRLLAPSSLIPSKGRPLGMATLDESRPVALTTEASLRHVHILGPTGVGKSTVMANMALADMAAGHGVVVIDPKGDLVTDLLERIPPERLADVVVLNPADLSPVGINGLGGDPDLAADTLLAVFHSLYADSWGPRTHDILHASLLSLSRRGDASLVMIPLLLTNAGFRRSVVGRVAKSDPMGLGAFWAWFESLSDGERSAAIAPLMNKLRPILLRPGMRGIFGQRRPRFHVSDVFTKHKILLVSLSKGELGPEAAQLLGSVVVSLVWNAARARSAVPIEQRSPVMLHIDEVQDYLRLPGDLGDALAQARSLKLGITAAHQMLSQLSPSIKEAFLANARSRITFQLSAKDAREIAATSRGQLVADDFTSLPAYQAYASLLVDGSPAPLLSLRTQPLPPRLRDQRVVRTMSARTYGRPLTEIEAELLSLVDATPRGSTERIGRMPRPSSAADHADREESPDA